MKSIYSATALQRILDRWSVGKIEDSTYFENVAYKVWQHHIETNQGTFVLYSYSEHTRDYSEEKLTPYLQENYQDLLEQLRERTPVHSFDRYHVLLQLTKKYIITAKQARIGLDALIGLRIERVFRAHGSIIQINFDTGSIATSYGEWSIHDSSTKPSTVVADTREHSRKQLDEGIAMLTRNSPAVKTCTLTANVLELHLSNGMQLHFTRSEKFAAIVLHNPTKKSDLHIFSEDMVFYSQELRN